MGTVIYISTIMPITYPVLPFKEKIVVQKAHKAQQRNSKEIRVP